jgi:hypothetical protein
MGRRGAALGYRERALPHPRASLAASAVLLAASCTPPPPTPAGTKLDTYDWAHTAKFGVGLGKARHLGGETEERLRLTFGGDIVMDLHVKRADFEEPEGTQRFRMTSYASLVVVRSETRVKGGCTGPYGAPAKGPTIQCRVETPDRPGGRRDTFHGFAGWLFDLDAAPGLRNVASDVKSEPAPPPHAS